jgi:hypothetical protein
LRSAPLRMKKRRINSNSPRSDSSALIAPYFVG